MASYDYEYFCGANVMLQIEGEPIIEAAAISYNYSDSQTPIYGYSSQFFDAVAPGQKLIQGTLVINFVHPDYLFSLMDRGRGTSTSIAAASGLSPTSEDLNGVTSDELLEAFTGYVDESIYEEDEDTIAVNAREIAIEEAQASKASVQQAIDDDKVIIDAAAENRTALDALYADIGEDGGAAQRADIIEALDTEYAPEQGKVGEDNYRPAQSYADRYDDLLQSISGTHEVLAEQSTLVQAAEAALAAALAQQAIDDDNAQMSHAEENAQLREARAALEAAQAEYDGTEEMLLEQTQESEDIQNEYGFSPEGSTSTEDYTPREGSYMEELDALDEKRNEARQRREVAEGRAPFSSLPASETEYREDKNLPMWGYGDDMETLYPTGAERAAEREAQKQAARNTAIANGMTEEQLSDMGLSEADVAAAGEIIDEDTAMSLEGRVAVNEERVAELDETISGLESEIRATEAEPTISADGAANVAEALKNKFWVDMPSNTLEGRGGIQKDPVSAHNSHIDITFLKDGGGTYRIRLQSVYFVGRGSAIQIDENTILEEYPFFARALNAGWINR